MRPILTTKMYKLKLQGHEVYKHENQKNTKRHVYIHIYMYVYFIVLNN